MHTFNELVGAFSDELLIEIRDSAQKELAKREASAKKTADETKSACGKCSTSSA